MRIFQGIFLISLLLISACEQKLKIEAAPALQGKWVFINYWATWCKPCRQEIPQLNAFYAAHKNKNILVVGVNYDHLAPEPLSKAISTMGIQFPVLQKDPAAQIGLEEPPALPVTYVIAPTGEIFTSLYGPQTKQDLEAVLLDANLL